MDYHILIKDNLQPHIVHYKGYHESDTHLYIFMEYIPCGDLTRFTYRDDLLTEQECQIVAYQTMQALDYLQQHHTPGYQAGQHPHCKP